MGVARLPSYGIDELFVEDVPDIVLGRKGLFDRFAILDTLLAELVDPHEFDMVAGIR